MLQKSVLLALVPAFVSAAVHNVDVGKSGLVFDPNSLTAAMGDTVNFHFYPGDHSVAQSTGSAPCVPSGADAIYSGFINPTSGEDSKMFQIAINSTDPIWLYCSQISHCQSGMAMVINPASGTSIKDYIKAAAKTSKSSSPPNVAGGAVVANSDTSSVSSGNSGSSSAAASASSAAVSSASAAASSAKAQASSAEAKVSSAAAKVSSAAAKVSSAASSAAAKVTSAAAAVSSAAAAATSTNAAAAYGVPAAAVAAGFLGAAALI